MNKLLEEAGIKPNYIDGIRVTDAKTLEIARGIFLQENLKLVEALERPPPNILRFGRWFNPAAVSRKNGPGKTPKKSARKAGLNQSEKAGVLHDAVAHLPGNHLGNLVIKADWRAQSRLGVIAPEEADIGFVGIKE